MSKLISVRISDYLTHAIESTGETKTDVVTRSLKQYFSKTQDIAVQADMLTLFDQAEALVEQIQKISKAAQGLKLHKRKDGKQCRK